MVFIHFGFCLLSYRLCVDLLCDVIVELICLLKFVAFDLLIVLLVVLVVATGL